MTTPISQCYGCKHYQKQMKCRAFDEIPREIFFNSHDHKKPYRGDKGIHYESKRT